MDELVSVIIPAYNVEQDIKNCIYSLLKQTHNNYEVIIIDDGSTDNTKMICETLSKSDERITVIHQMNSGVSVARNIGLQLAKGKWILFLDADDYLAPETMKNALQLAEEKTCDTVCWNCHTVLEDEIADAPAIFPDGASYQGVKMRQLMIEALYGTRDSHFYPGMMFRAVWGKILSANIIRQNNIAFPVGVPLGEDAAFLAEYFHCCKKVTVVNKYWNYYRISSSSAVGKYRDNLVELQNKELEVLIHRIHSDEVDVDTLLINQYLQFDYQYIHNLLKKDKNLWKVYNDMLKYIKGRRYNFKTYSCYDMNKVHKKSWPVIWAMINKLGHLEALLCVLREIRHRG